MWKHLEKEEVYVMAVLLILAASIFTYVIASDLV